MNESATHQAPCPVTLLTGFLGAGKTTLLSRLLSEPRGVRFGVLVNDFGAINIDAGLVGEMIADQISLTNGCVCCSIQDDLRQAVRQMLDADAPPDHLLIEASGVSRPLAIVDALEGEPGVSVDGVFCLIDAWHFEGLDYADTELAMDQAFAADIVLVNKADLVDGATLARIDATLHDAMPRMRTVPTRHGDAAFELMFGPERAGASPSMPGGPKREAGTGEAAGDGHQHDHEHDSEFESWSWVSCGALDEPAFRAATAAFPHALLRAKGVVNLGGKRAVFQLVGKRRTIDLQAGSPPQENRLVAIARRGCLPGAELDTALHDCHEPH